jgi:long-chain fatty acid transport protein
MTRALCRRLLAGALMLGLAVVRAPSAHASGFAVDNQGARALGLAGAAVAQASDASAVFYNAAGVAFLKGTQVYLSGGLAGSSTDFVGEGPFPPAATLEHSGRLYTVLPSLYASRLMSSRLAVGIGFGSPFDTHSQWQDPDQFTGRFLCADCRIRSWSLNPTLAYKLADRLAVGLGLDLRFSNLRLDQRLAAVPGVSAQSVDVAAATTETSTQTAVGFNLGLQASPRENVTIGLAYRHKVQAAYAASARFTQILTGDASLDAAVAANLPPLQTATVAHYFPGHVAAGLAMRHGGVLVEADLGWTLWSSFDSIEVRYPASPALSQSLPQAHETAFEGRIGVEYLLGPSWAVRGGYSYDQSPQPAATYSPFLHDVGRHGLSLGGTWNSGKAQVDLVARYLPRRSASTLGQSRYDYDGSYQTSAFQLGVSFAYRF